MSKLSAKPNEQELAEEAELLLGDHFHVRHAHKYVAAYVFMLVLLLVMGAVYTWQHNKTEALNTQVQNLQTQVGSLTQKLSNLNASTPLPKPALPSTATWKTYCDPTHGECFKYPGDWTLNFSQDAFNRFGYVLVTLTNPAKTLVINYSNNFVKDGFGGAFHTNVLADPATAGTGLKVAGGYFLASTRYQPTFAAVTTAVAAKQALQVGAMSQLVDQPRFSDRNNQTASFTGGPSTNTITTRQQADAWFDSIAAQTVQAIVQSIYYK